MFVRALATVASATMFFVLAAPDASAQRANWPASVKLGTAQPGGAYVVYGGGVARLISEKLGVTASPQQTDGPNHNMILTDTKRLELGMITMGVGFEGWNGDGDWTQGRKMQNVRALFPMYETPFHIIALAKSGITTAKQLAGKNVGVGPRGGTPGTFFPRFFQDLGIAVTIRNGSGSAMGQMLGDGQLDAFAFAAGIPMPVFSEIEVTNPSVIFSFTADESKILIDRHKFLSPFTIPQGTYKSAAGALPTISVWNFAIAHKDLPADFIYEVVKLVHESEKEMVQTFAAAAETLPKNVVHNKFMPFHPGATRYYREKGLTIPAELAPQS